MAKTPATRKKRSWTVLLILGIALLGYYLVVEDKPKKIKSAGEQYEVQFKPEGSLAFLRDNGDTIKSLVIEVADDERQRTQGLMYRGKLTDEQGMLFIFDREEVRSFWMKNTYISLDILFVRSDGQIELIYPNTIPYSEDPLLCRQPTLYVVEVVAGFCDQYGVRQGHHIAFKLD